MSLTDYNLTPKAKKAIKDAKLFATSNSHTLIRIPHLFYGCLCNLSDRVQILFEGRGVEYLPKEYLKDFKHFCASNDSYFLRSKNENAWHSELNDLIADAKSFADDNEDFFIGVDHILYCILSSQFCGSIQSDSCDVLKMSEVLLELIIDANLVVSKSEGFHPEDTESKEFLELLKTSMNDEPSKFLSEYCINLNDQAMQKNQVPITSRDEEIDSLIEILSKKNKSNAILLGDSGVGKTAIAEGLAQKIVRDEVPAHISLCTVYSVDMPSMVAGTQYRGQFEERFKGLLKDVESHPEAILFIDEIHTLMGAGNSSENGIDASNMLKPALARGDVKCIGATTFKEYEKSFGKDPALKRRFDKVEVKEPTKEQTELMINNSISYYENFHKVKYSKRNIRDILDLSEIYLSNKKFPEKAFDIIDQVGAKAKIEQDYPAEDLANIRERFSAKGEDSDTEEKTGELIKEYIKDLVSYIDKEDKKEKFQGVRSLRSLKRRQVYLKK